MTAQDRVRWDDIYRKRTSKPYPAPDPLLFDYVPPVMDRRPQHGLDLAGGFGQNGLWLASQGYIVDILDISRVALSRARGEMAMRNLRNVNLLQVDLDDCELDEQHYHIVCVFRYLKRNFLPRLLASIVPGGRIIYESLNVLYLDVVPEFNQEFLLSLGELEAIFDGWGVLFYEENDHISQIAAIKPGDPLAD